MTTSTITAPVTISAMPYTGMTMEGCGGVGVGGGVGGGERRAARSIVTASLQSLTSLNSFRVLSCKRGEGRRRREGEEKGEWREGRGERRRE